MYSEENYRPRPKSGYDYEESAARGLLLYLLLFREYISNTDDICIQRRTSESARSQATTMRNRLREVCCFICCCFVYICLYISNTDDAIIREEKLVSEGCREQ